MPYKLSKRKTKEGVKYCMTSKDSGKTYCYPSEQARKEGMKMHEAFSHGFKPTNKK